MVGCTQAGTGGLFPRGREVWRPGPFHVTTGASSEALLSHLPWLRLPWGLERLHWMGWATSVLETQGPQL